MKAPEPYASLARLHRRSLAQGFALDGVLLAVALVYVFGARASLDLSVSRGVFLLAGFTFAALLHGQILRRGAAAITFYLRLPARRLPALSWFYAVTAIPPLAALLVLAAFLFALLPGAWTPAAELVRERVLQAAFGLLFVRSLTVNLLAALRVHAALVAGYYVALVGCLVYLSWLREALLPVVRLGPAAFGLLFLAFTFGVSLLAVRRVGL